MIAFDIALHTTGAAWDGGSDTYTCPNNHQPAGKRSGDRPEIHQRRLAWWRTTFRGLIRQHADGLVWVEMPVIHSANPNGAIPTFELHGALKLAAFDEHATVLEMQNTKMKSWAHKVEGIVTRWPMDKDDMLAVARHLGCDTQSHDEADAFILYTMVNA